MPCGAPLTAGGRAQVLEPDAGRVAAAALGDGEGRRPGAAGGRGYARRARVARGDTVILVCRWRSLTVIP